MQNQVDTLVNYLKGIWLNRKYILLFAWIICPIGWGIVTMLPNQYTSKAKVYADTQSILRPLLRGLAIQSDPKQKLELMAKTLLNTRNLETIAQEVDANITANTAEEYDQILEDLRSGIKINLTDRINLYTISYSNHDPVYAKRVVQAALNVFIESTIGDKRLDNEKANNVINEQIAYYDRRLIEAERELSEFKRKNIGVMSGTDKGYYENLTNEEALLETAQFELAKAKSRANEVKSQLEKEKENSKKLNNTVQTEYDGRIDFVEKRLDELMFRYTSKHPDVIETNRQLTELKRLKSEVLNNTTTDDELFYSAVFQDLKITLNQINNDIASLVVRIEKHKKKINDLKGMLYIVPEVEAKLTSLTRNYNIIKDKYMQLLSRGETALISNSIGSSAQDIKFRIIETPNIPSTASGPNRLILLSVVFVLGLGSGTIVAFLTSQIKPVVTTTSQLYQLTGVPVFGVVLATPSSGLLSRQKRSLLFFILMTVLLFVGLVFSITFNLMPSLFENIQIQQIDLFKKLLKMD